MEQHARDYLVSRICCGFLRYYKCKIYNPTLEIMYEANEVFSKTFAKAINNGLMIDRDIYNMLLDREIWTEENEKNLTLVLPKHIDYWKVEMYRSLFQTNKLQTCRNGLATAKKELYRLHQIRHAFDYATANGIAQYAKLQYIIEKSTYGQRGLYKWKKSSPYLAMLHYQNNIIAEDSLRELARTSPWDIIWQASKKNGPIFPKSGIELSLEQQRLIIWSNMFDSIREYPDCPTDNVIEDDDLLDGWLITKRQERESESQKTAIDARLKNSKVGNATEIFFPADTIEDAKKLDVINSDLGRSIKKQRFDFIAKKGEVKEQHLPDIQRQLAMDVNNAMIQSVKGRK